MFTHEHKQRLSSCILQWTGTPYIAGQMAPGRGGGVDCVRWCWAALHATYNLPLADLPRMAQDAAFHDAAVVKHVTRIFWRQFDWFSVDPRLPLKAADMLAVRQLTPLRPDEPNPHHVFIVGPDRIRCYDSWPSTGLRMIGIGGVRTCFEILHVYRSRMGYEPPR